MAVDSAIADADSVLVEAALQKILSSGALEKSETSQRLLRYLAERGLRGETPKEVEIAIDVFGRDASFNSAEESLVRVAVRALRLRLFDYYAGPGQREPLRFDIPKGAYRLVWTAREEALRHEPPSPLAPEAPIAEQTPRPGTLNRWVWSWALAATVLLMLSLGFNLRHWREPAVISDPEVAGLARSPLWSGIVDSDRPLMLVFGDGFMYTNVDPLTGRVQLIRDRAINSSEELRVFLAENPSIAPGRGQRYTSMLQKSTALGMASLLQLVSHAGRTVEVRAPDDLKVDDVQRYDIIYVGPLSRLGLLAGHYELQSRYRYESHRGAIHDIVADQSFLPEGELTAKHTEYALAARFDAPGGNHVIILTPGARNSGMMQIIRMVTSESGLADLQKKLPGDGAATSFEALLSVTSFGQTDVTGELLAVHPLPNSALAF
jgi:hypothetical protein